MARSSLTVTTMPAWGDGLADAGFEAADQSNGNDFALNAPCVVLINNGSGGSLTVTLNLPASRHTANDAQTKTFAVADGDIGVCRLEPDLYRQADYKGWIDWSTDTSVTVAVCQETPTPGI